MTKRGWFFSLAAILTLLLARVAAVPAASAEAGGRVFQSADIDQLLREAADLESKAAKLRQAVENCRRRVTPQSPDCQVYIEWRNAVVAYQEAERLAAVLEEQAREKRRLADGLRPRPSPPPVTNPVNTQPTAPAPPRPQPGGQSAAGQGVVPPPLAGAGTQPAPPPAAVPAPRVGEVRIGGLTSREWDQLRDYQAQLDRIYSRWPVPAGDVDRLDKLEAARNRLWRKAVSAPGLTVEERQRLRLLLHTRSQTADTPVLRKEPAEAPAGKTKYPPPPFPTDVAEAIVESHVETGAQQALDELGKDWAEVVNLSDVDRGLLNYENVVGVGRISLKLKEKNYAGAVSETFDFVLGKVVLPLTSMNVNVFKSVYSRATFGALNRFMEDSMKAVGAEFDWEEMAKDMNLGQKAVMEWVGLSDLVEDKIKEKKEGGR